MTHTKNAKFRFLVLFSLVFIFGTSGIYLTRWTAKDDIIIVTAHGAAGQVSGSLFHIEYGSNSILVDIGLFYPDGEGTYEVIYPPKTGQVVKVEKSGYISHKTTLKNRYEPSKKPTSIWS